MHRYTFVSTALVCLLAAPASWGQTDNPTIESIAALPTCKAQLTACKATLISTQGQLKTCRNTVKNAKTKLAICASDLEDCQTDLDACEAEPRVIFPGDGRSVTPDEQAVGITHGPALSYTDNGDGTITDNNTQLMWEKKDNVAGSIHHVENGYQWSSGEPFSPQDGNLFMVFLATLNTAPCFAGHCDWRIPNIKELASIINYAAEFPASSLPGINTTAYPRYWSSTTMPNRIAPFTWVAWAVNLQYGEVYFNDKRNTYGALAVRGGQ